MIVTIIVLNNENDFMPEQEQRKILTRSRTESLGVKYDFRMVYATNRTRQSRDKRK